MKSSRLLTLACAMAAALLCGPLAHAQSPTSTLERVSSFEYDADGLLIKEVVEPDRPNDCQQTNYTYDAYGNRTSASSAACTGATGHTISSAATARTITSAYAAQTVTIGGTSYSIPAGSFATSTSNALGQTEAKEFDPPPRWCDQADGP